MVDHGCDSLLTSSFCEGARTMLTFVECKVRSLKDQSLFTGAQRYELLEGEIFLGIFKNEHTVDALEDVGVIEVVDESVPEEKVFPVIPLGASAPTFLKTASGEELPLSGGLED